MKNPWTTFSSAIARSTPVIGGDVTRDGSSTHFIVELARLDEQPRALIWTSSRSRCYCRCICKGIVRGSYWHGGLLGEMKVGFGYLLKVE